MHENHRDRLRERFLSEGLDSFQPHEALELLLFYAIPRRDTNEIAHRLLQRYNSLAGVFDAHPQDLEQIEGMGRNSAVLLALMTPLWRMYRRDSTVHGKPLDNYKAASTFAIDLFVGRVNESLYMLCLDPYCRLIKDIKLHEGTVNEVSVHPRTVVEAAIRNNASQVILVHNHPRGETEPSSNDITYTRHLAVALSSIGINLIDHIIVSEDTAYSFAKEGRMEKILREVEVRISLDTAEYVSWENEPESEVSALRSMIRKYSLED